MIFADRFCFKEWDWGEVRPDSLPITVFLCPLTPVTGATSQFAFFVFDQCVLEPVVGLYVAMHAFSKLPVIGVGELFERPEAALKLNIDNVISAPREAGSCSESRRCTACSNRAFLLGRNRFSL